jgi:hypothetical protein
MAKTKTTEVAKRELTKQAVRAVLDRDVPAIWKLLSPRIDDWLERKRTDKVDPREIPPGAAIHSLLTECASQDVAYLLASSDAELTVTSHREIADVFGYSANTVKQSWSQWLEPTSGGEYRIADICSQLFRRGT